MIKSKEVRKMSVKRTNTYNNRYARHTKSNEIKWTPIPFGDLVITNMYGIVVPALYHIEKKHHSTKYMKIFSCEGQKFKINSSLEMILNQYCA